MMKKSVFRSISLWPCLLLSMAMNSQAVGRSDQEEKEQNQVIEIPSLVGLSTDAIDVLGIVGAIKWDSELSQDQEYRSSARHLGLIAPYLSAQKLLELDEFLPMIRERAPEALSEAESEISFTDRVISHSDCLKYFGNGGLFERTKKLKFTQVEIDPKCIAEFPKSMTEISLIKTKITRPKIDISSFTPAFIAQQSFNDEESVQQFSKLVISPKVIDQNEIRELVQFRNLTHLAISGSWLSTTDAKEIAQNFPELRSLDLSDNSIDDSGAYEILQSLPYLTSLNLSSNWIAQDIAEKIVRETTHIPHLNLSDNTGRPQGAQRIARWTGPLTHLTTDQLRVLLK